MVVRGPRCVGGRVGVCGGLDDGKDIKA